MISSAQSRYQCPVELALDLIGGKWKVLILFYLKEHGTLRYGELSARIQGISKKILTQQLHQLEEDGLIHRQAFPEVPPRVEYSLSDYGKSLKDILSGLCRWGASHASKNNIPIGNWENHLLPKQ